MHCTKCDVLKSEYIELNFQDKFSNIKRIINKIKLMPTLAKEYIWTSNYKFGLYEK